MKDRDPQDNKASRVEEDSAGEKPAGYSSLYFTGNEASEAFRAYLKACQRVGEACEVLFLAESAHRASQGNGEALRDAEEDYARSTYEAARAGLVYSILRGKEENHPETQCDCASCVEARSSSLCH